MHWNKIHWNKMHWNEMKWDDVKWEEKDKLKKRHQFIEKREIRITHSSPNEWRKKSIKIMCISPYLCSQPSLHVQHSEKATYNTGNQMHWLGQIWSTKNLKKKENKESIEHDRGGEIDWGWDKDIRKEVLSTKAIAYEEEYTRENGNTTERKG